MPLTESHIRWSGSLHREARLHSVSSWVKDSGVAVVAWSATGNAAAAVAATGIDAAVDGLTSISMPCSCSHLLLEAHLLHRLPSSLLCTGDNLEVWAQYSGVQGLKPPSRAPASFWIVSKVRERMHAVSVVMIRTVRGLRHKVSTQDPRLPFTARKTTDA